MIVKYNGKTINGWLQGLLQEYDRSGIRKEIRPIKPNGPHGPFIKFKYKN